MPMTTESVFAHDLQRLQLSVGVSERISGLDDHQPLMKGHFCSNVFEGGLSMHAMDAVENQNTRNSIELPPGISFNFIFSGTISYRFAGNEYWLLGDPDQTTCSVIVNNTMEVMNRKMVKGEHIKKLNIFVDRGWLESRCRSEADVKKLNSLFARKQVYSLHPDKPVFARAKRLIQVKPDDDFSDNIAAEAATTDLLSCCLLELFAHVGELQKQNPSSEIASSSTLKIAINDKLASCHTLNQIAAALGMSERTLQRKFQQSYQQPVSTYIKQRRMEKAKAALLIDNKSVGEAAYIAGYKHPSNFVNAFKKYTGKTPSTFVKSNR